MIPSVSSPLSSRGRGEERGSKEMSLHVGIEKC